MKIKLLIFLLFLSTICLGSTITINQTYTNYVELTPFGSINNASSITITGNVALNSDTSLVRIVLVDNIGEEYMLFESYSMIVDTNVYSFSNYTDETKYLHNINPLSLRIYVEDASLQLQSIYVNTNTRTSTFSQTETLRHNYYVTMNQQKIVRLNNQISKRRMRWTAGETAWGNLYCRDKKIEFGGSIDYNSYGFEYQIDGAFSFPQEWDVPLLKTDPYVVFEYDVRNLHNALDPQSPYYNPPNKINGHNALDTLSSFYNPNSTHGWLTPTKDQLYEEHPNTSYACGSCWAFAAVAVVEGIVNLYFNRHIDFNLSEQQIVSFTPPKVSRFDENGNYIGLSNTCKVGGFPYDALQYISKFGIVEESCIPYMAADIDSSIYNISSCAESIFIKDIHFVSSQNNALKQAIVRYGPIAGSITIGKFGHAMALVGWQDYNDGTIDWIYKDSNPWGSSGLRKISSSSSATLSSNYRASYSSCFTYTDSDRVCVDMDGDGYYNWGIGEKPATCPDCAPDTLDGNDADSTIGPVDEYGHPILPFTPLLIADTEVTSSQTWSNNRTICGDLIIKDNAILTLTGTILMQASHKIYVKNGSKLIINGGKTSLGGITVENGGTLTLNGNGTIEIFKPADVTIQIGGIFNHNWGEITIVNPFMPN